MEQVSAFQDMTGAGAGCVLARVRVRVRVGVRVLAFEDTIGSGAVYVAGRE